MTSEIIETENEGEEFFLIGIMNINKSNGIIENVFKRINFLSQNLS